MDRDPELPTARVVKVFPKGIGAAWIEALARPEADTKVAAAQAIALAHRQGMTGLDAAVGPLTRELDRPGQHATVRLAVAHALVTLDARTAADSLFRALAGDDAEVRELVEPALAKWDYRPMRALWLERLGQGPPHRRRHLLAMRGLGQVREEKAVPALRELAMSPSAATPIRVEAAFALSTIQTAGLETDAAALAGDASARGTTGRLVAATLLRKHKGDETVRLLQALGRDAEPAVAAAALARLVELDTRLVVPLLEPVLASVDANVRTHGVEVLFRQPTDGHIRLLGDRLSDRHPDVRTRARVVLRELARQPGFNGPVIREGTRVLATTDWRGQEQAALLLAQLDHKPATGRLLDLMKVERPETMVAVGWALRTLAVPDTLPAVLDFIRNERQAMLATALRTGTFVAPPPKDHQLSQLVQFLASARYRQAEPLFLEMIPRRLPGLPTGVNIPPPGPESRAAAVWALGLFHDGKAGPTLVTALQGRMADLPSPAGAEDDRVRRMAAVSLGRMRAAEAVPTLRRFYEGKPSLNPVNNASGWALMQITGEAVPAPGIIEQIDRAWFLYRLD